MHTEPSYKYMSSAAYINSLHFDYIETYSFRRGEGYEEELKRMKSEYDKLKVRKEKRNNLILKEVEKLEELTELFSSTQYLLNQKGQLHFSSILTNRFQNDDPAVALLTSILQTDIKQVPQLLCAPEYRDGIVFYDKDKNIVSILNVCLSCMYLETQMFNHVNADFETYDLLKRFFIGIGHDIEEPTYFIMDEINKLKAKHSKSKHV